MKHFYIRYAMSICVNAETREEAKEMFENMDLSNSEFVEIEEISEY